MNFEHHTDREPNKRLKDLPRVLQAQENTFYQEANPKFGDIVLG